MLFSFIYHVMFSGQLRFTSNAGKYTRSLGIDVISGAAVKSKLGMWYF